MIDRIGMCTVCAKVCHKGHDVSYAKYGSFFCDCGAKEDGSCKALTKRQGSKNHDSKSKKSAKSSKPRGDSSNLQKLKRTKLASSSSSTKFDSNLKLSETGIGNTLASTEMNSSISQPTIDVKRRLVWQIRANKSKQIEKLRNEITQIAKDKNLIHIIRRFISDVLMPVAKQKYDSSLLVTNFLISRSYLAQLKAQTFELPDYVRLNCQTQNETAKSSTSESGRKKA